MAVIARRDQLTRAHILNVITDYEAEPIWVRAEVEAYAVADERVRAEVCAWGASPESVTTSGIPVDPSFRVQHDRRATRARYGINDDAPIVLLMGGGMGPTHMDEVAARLCKSGERMHVIAIAGRDRRARQKLSRLSTTAAISLHVQGWVDDIPALMQAASVLATKPGGVTTAEAALCRLPLILFDAIPGPEERNATRFAQTGAGVITHGADETAAAILSLLRDERMRRAMAACAAQLARPQAASIIARLALGIATEVRPKAAVKRRMA